MELRIHKIRNYLLVLNILVVSSNASKVTDFAGRSLSRGTDRGMTYANFKAHKFSFLNITNIGSDYVFNGSECGFACVNIHSCFSFNLAASSDIMSGKILCELLPSDLYKNSKEFVPSQFHHHYSITSPCISWPCQNNGTCATHYEKNSYACVCAKGFTGKYCETDNSRNCADLYKAGERISGVYTIKPDDGEPFDVYCDQKTAGGGWTVIQKRLDGSVDFYRGWADYKRGFGNLNGEFWLGLDKMHRLTKEGKNRIRVDLEDTKGNTAYADYDMFAVASERLKYQLRLGTYSGTTGDSFAYQRGAPFSTKDQDNDPDARHCAVTFKGGWWYTTCRLANLNGLYHLGPHESRADGINWRSWKGDYYSAKRSEMKIRPADF